MVNTLKTIIKNKKLYFLTRASKSNTFILSNLIAFKVVNSAYKILNKRSKFYIVFINYNFSLSSAVSALIFASKKDSSKKNNNLDVNKLNKNFNLNIQSKNNKKSYKNIIKFR